MHNFDEADNMCPNCVTPWKCNGPHLDDETPAARRARNEDLPDVWKALEDDEAFVAALFRGIADIKAGRTVKLRFEPCWNCHGMTSYWVDEDGTPRDVLSLERAQGIDERDEQWLQVWDASIAERVREDLAILTDRLITAVEEIPDIAISSDISWKGTVWRKSVIEAIRKELSGD